MHSIVLFRVVLVALSWLVPHTLTWSRTGQVPHTNPTGLAALHVGRHAVHRDGPPRGIVCIYIYIERERERESTLDSECQFIRSQELCESRGGRPGLPVPNSPAVVSVDVKRH